MQETQTEIDDVRNLQTEHFNGTITTAGSPITITTSTNRVLRLAYFYNPEKGPLANDPGDLLYISYDGTNKTTLSRGQSIMWPGAGYGTYSNTIKLDTNANGTNYEIMVIS